VLLVAGPHRPCKQIAGAPQTMDTNSNNDLQYLRDTVEAYKRRHQQETEPELRSYLWSRIHEIETQLQRLGSMQERDGSSKSRPQRG